MFTWLGFTWKKKRLFGNEGENVEGGIEKKDRIFQQKTSFYARHFES